jgi:nickel transport system permease protein
MVKRIGFALPLSRIGGVLCAKFEGTLFDRLIRGLMFRLNAMPAYWIGALLIWGVAVKLNLLPTSGKEGGMSFVLPVIALSLSHFRYYLRLSGLIGCTIPMRTIYGMAGPAALKSG